MNPQVCLLSLLGALLLLACSEDSAPVDLEINIETSNYPKLTWPVSGTDGRDWTINNYVDLDPSSGMLDYRGGAKVYDGHKGVDIDSPDFRAMDRGFPILAAAPGIVSGLRDGEYDRNMSCAGQWNYVSITHADGSRAIYGHLKKGSVSVSLGDTVSLQQILGLMGSSGCSTHPHLHLELRSSTGQVLDPFELGLWIDPPKYDTPLTFMSMSLRDGHISSIDEVKDPPADATELRLGSRLGIGLSMAGGGPGDHIGIEITDGDGIQRYNLGRTFERIWRHTWWWWNVFTEGSLGTWTIEIRVNGALVNTSTVTVN
ncbi:MAG TPA: hypothetical protein DEF01_05930 [Gemmatimonadetes bacterium]|nr:hypothetical protein [Gemmatimonadota bacterium]